MIPTSIRHQHRHGRREQKALRRRSVWLFSFAILILSLSLLPTNLLASKSPKPSQKKDTAALSSTSSALSHAFMGLAKQAKTSVVNITVKRNMTGDPNHPNNSPYPDVPFLQQLFQQSSVPEEEIPFPGGREQGIGSGVIISSDGYILTNHHVVDQAYDIHVQLNDERIFQAELIGTDQPTDMAILKIQASQLPAFQWGNSDHLKVGEIVMSVGNPFGLSSTMTMGIISATGRGNVGFVDYESFIQTDAAINLGNSGGALLNLKGELIGINTAILQESREMVGFGFAIPSRMAKSAASSIMTQGKVSRGWIGMATQKLTPELAIHFNTSHEQGVVITDLYKDGPAARGKLQRRDVIVAYQGTPITDPRHLHTLVAETLPGTSITLRRLQDGKGKDMTIRIEEFPFETIQPTRLKPKDADQLLTGVTVEPLPKKFPWGKEGVLVGEIAPGSLVDRQGLEEGDMILDINQAPIRSVKDFEQLRKQLKSQDTALLLLRRQNATMFLPLHKGK